MRRRLVLYTLALLGGMLLVLPCANVLAQSGNSNPANVNAPSSASPIRLVSAGASYRYRVDTSVLPAKQYGAIALFDHDGAGARGGVARPSLWPALAAAPTDWPRKGLSVANSPLGEAPLATSRGSEKCQCKTLLGDSSARRYSVLYASHVFRVASSVDLSRYSLLSLRVRYRDGLRAYLNGQPIASRNLPSPGAERTSALATKGPEWEEFLVPLNGKMIVPGENLLSFEVRPGQYSQGLRLDASMELQVPGRVVRGPMVQRVEASGASICFDTDLAAKAHVEYGPTAALGARAESALGALARHHRVWLSGLKAGEAVYYRVVIAAAAGPTHVFHVPPSAPEPLRFAVYGDVRGGHRVHEQIVSSLLSEAIDFVIVTGDMVLRGADEADWQRFFSITGPLLSRLPYYPVAGNHDLGKTGDEQRHMSEVFSLWPAPAGRPPDAAWHSFDMSQVHFVMLDSNRYGSAAQLTWLRSDLAAARERGVRAIFAVSHAGPYSRGPHGGNRYAAEHYAPLLAQFRVTLVFSGHDHLYQRGSVGGLHYIVSGGGGAPLYSVRCGVAGKPRCAVDDGMKFVASEYHYLVVTVYPGQVSVCPKRVDRSPLEACIRYPLP